MQIIAQILGSGAIICSVILYSRKKRGTLLLVKGLQDILWLVHYLLLGCYTPAATSLLNISRSAVFYNNQKKWGKSKLWLVGYLILYALAAVLTWKNVFSIFPAISSSLSTVAFWMKNPRHTKMLAIPASVCTLVYNIAQSHSLAVYVGISFTVLTSIYSLWQTREK